MLADMRIGLMSFTNRWPVREAIFGALIIMAIIQCEKSINTNEAKNNTLILGKWYCPDGFGHELKFFDPDSVTGTLRISDPRLCSTCGPLDISGTFTFEYPNVEAHDDSTWQLSGVMSSADTILQVTFSSEDNLFWDIDDTAWVFYRDVGANFDLKPFRTMAKYTICADSSNRLFLIDKQFVLWDRRGNCPDNSYSLTLYGESPDEIICYNNDSIEGPRSSCEDNYQEMFNTIINNLENSDLGLGKDYQVEEILFK